MIRLLDIPKPEILTDEFVKEATQRFMDAIGEKPRVWKVHQVIEAVKAMGRDKCAYCECQLGEESKDLHVDHFHPKSRYPEEVLDWENLLPSCKRCNEQKGDHDTKHEPILNPRRDAPHAHLFLKAGRIGGKSPLGAASVRILKLNDETRLVPRRTQLIYSLRENLDKDATLLKEDPSPAVLKRLAIALEVYLSLAVPESSYAATMATVLLGNEDFQNIKSSLASNGMWTDRHRELEASVSTGVLELR